MHERGCAPRGVTHAVGGDDRIALGRDPDDAPDTNMDGFNFWLQKMDDHTLAGEDARLEADAFARIKRAEMIRAFIISLEYRGRFGP